MDCGWRVERLCPKFFKGQARAERESGSELDRFS